MSNPGINPTDHLSFMLDPLMTVVKLAIVGLKPSGSKLSIHSNILHIQEPTFLQPALRYISGDNKGDLHYLLYPIESACKTFLENNKDKNTISYIFDAAQRGIAKLIETYAKYPVITHCLNLYNLVIGFYLGQRGSVAPTESVQGVMRYDANIVERLDERWTTERLQLLVMLFKYAETHNEAIEALEVFLAPLDKETIAILNAS